jgi:ATP-dependent Zn protease
MKNLMIGIAVGFGFSVAFFTLMANRRTSLAPPEISYSQFVADVDGGKIEEVTFQGSKIVGRFTIGHTFRTLAPHSQLLPALTDRLLAKKVTVTTRPVEDDQSYVTSWIASLIVQGVFFGALWVVHGAPAVGARTPARRLRQVRAARGRQAAITIHSRNIGQHRARANARSRSADVSSNRGCHARNGRP